MEGFPNILDLGLMQDGEWLFWNDDAATEYMRRIAPNMSPLMVKHVIASMPKVETKKGGVFNTTWTIEGTILGEYVLPLLKSFIPKSFGLRYLYENAIVPGFRYIFGWLAWCVTSIWPMMLFFSVLLITTLLIQYVQEQLRLEQRRGRLHMKSLKDAVDDIVVSDYFPACPQPVRRGLIQTAEVVSRWHRSYELIMQRHEVVMLWHRYQDLKWAISQNTPRVMYMLLFLAVVAFSFRVDRWYDFGDPRMPENHFSENINVGASDSWYKAQESANYDPDTKPLIVTVDEILRPGFTRWGIPTLYRWIVKGIPPHPQWVDIPMDTSARSSTTATDGLDPSQAFAFGVTTSTSTDTVTVTVTEKQSHSGATARQQTPPPFEPRQGWMEKLSGLWQNHGNWKDGTNPAARAKTTPGMPMKTVKDSRVPTWCAKCRQTHCCDHFPSG